MLELARQHDLSVPRRAKRKKSLLIEFLVENGLLQGSGVNPSRQQETIPVETLVEETVSVPAEEAPGLVQRTLEKISGWINWLGSAGRDFISTARSGVKRQFREFARQFFFMIERQADPREFFRIISQEALRVLRCEMVQTDMILEEEIVEEAAFHSGVEMNLEGDSSLEIWERMIEVCLASKTWWSFKEEQATGDFRE